MNLLSGETSPYLLQHADNPVHWMPWSDQAWKRAREENKLVILSIGYSACHWCHVMEHEVFEDDSCALLMNEHFISIKVDREERPDIDQVYMLAVQLMTGRGGWPLNCFCLPDGRPIHGGTYFPKQNWISLLENLQDLHKSQPQKLNEYAERLSQGIAGIGDNNIGLTEDIKNSEVLDPKIHALVAKWKPSWDPENGGQRRAPKFPMPSNGRFLLHHGVRTQSREEVEHVLLTLERMALGGICDQVGGGFARYSVDDIWKVPHFEKMLYDNAQLITLYSEAFALSREILFSEVVKDTLAFVHRELLSPEGLFYSALDADSEGEEGKFYTWTAAEFRSAIGDSFPWAEAYFGVNEDGFWEKDLYILLRAGTDEEFSERQGIGVGELKEAATRIRGKLLAARNARVRPALDVKCLCSWNALLVRALVDAHVATGDQEYLNQALRSAAAMLKHFRTAEGTLRHSWTTGRLSDNGFLEDYAFTCTAFIALWQSSGEEQWAIEARKFCRRALEQFYDPSTGLFWYTDETTHDLFTRQKEMEDNVIPSSNSEMAKALFLLARIFGEPTWEEIAWKMVASAINGLENASSGSNWLQVGLWITGSFREVVVSGPGAHGILAELRSVYRPDMLACTSTSGSSLPILQGRFGSESAIYVCTGKTCHSPVKTLDEVWPLIA